MKIETDPKITAVLAARVEQENWRFRSYLKMTERPSHEIDAIVHRLYRAVSAKIDCRACRNCCRGTLPIVDDKQIAAMARGLDMPEDDFRARYIEKAEGGFSGEFTFNADPCPMLDGGDCRVEACQPEDCRSFPHIQKDEFVFRLRSVVHNTLICPIVYNVVELLKNELRYDDREAREIQSAWGIWDDDDDEMWDDDALWDEDALDEKPKE